MPRDDQKFIVRLPDEAKAFIVSQAAKFGSSQNSEIIRCIRERMEKLVREEMTAPAGE